MTALNGMYLNQHFKEVGENIMYSPPPNIGFFLLTPIIFFSFSRSKKSLASFRPLQTHFSLDVCTYHSGSLPGYPVSCPSIGGILKLLFDNSFDF